MTGEQLKARPLRKIPAMLREGTTFFDVEDRKLALLKHLDMMGEDLAMRMVGITYVNYLKGLRRESRPVFMGIDERLKTLTETTASYMGNFEEVHDAIYGEMGRVAGTRDSPAGWRILNETMVWIYGSQLDFLIGASRSVGQLKTLDQADKLWEAVVEKNDLTLERMHQVEWLLKELSLSGLEGYRAASHFSREVENRHNPSWVRQEKDRARVHLDDALSMAKAAKAIENPNDLPSVYGNIGGHYREAANIALKAASVNLRSNFRDAARDNVVDFFVLAADNFAKAGETEQARFVLAAAEEAALTTLRRRRMPRELIRLRRRLADLHE